MKGDRLRAVRACLREHGRQCATDIADRLAIYSPHDVHMLLRTMERRGEAVRCEPLRKHRQLWEYVDEGAKAR